MMRPLESAQEQADEATGRALKLRGSYREGMFRENLAQTAADARQRFQSLKKGTKDGEQPNSKK